MNKKCTVHQTANILGKRWVLQIILELYKGEHRKRFSEIKESLPGITAKMLSARLKELEKEGIIKKEIDSSKFPIKCEYFLTKSGEDFIKIIKDIKKWTLRWNIKNDVCENSDCKNCSLQ